MFIDSQNLRNNNYIDNRVVFTPLYNTKTTSIGVLIPVGSITENDKSYLGFSHFLEHMIFKGTHNMNYEQINKEFEKMGAYLNAFTGKYYTLYYFHSLREFAKPCLELLLNMIYNSTLPEEEIEKEKKVIIEEILSYKDSPEDFLQEQFYYKTFENSFFATPILGTEDIIKTITRDTLLQYYKKHYTNTSYFISIAGAYDQEDLKQTIQNFMNQLPDINPTPYSFKQTIPFHSGQHVHYKNDLEQAYLCLGINTHNLGISKYTLKLFNIILGGMSSSRLYLKIREMQALCYQIDSSFYSDPNTSFFTIFGSTQVSQLEILIKALDKELQLLKNKPITEEELLIAKNQIKTRLAFRQESIVQSMMRSATQHFFYGKIINDHWLVEKIDSITLKNFEGIYNILEINQASLHILMPKNK